MDCVYANNHYFVYEDSSQCIWKKAVDGSEPEKWFQYKVSQGTGKSLRRALKGRYIAVNKEGKQVILLSTTDSEDVKEMWGVDGEELVDLQIFGENEDKVAITSDRWLWVDSIKEFGGKLNHRKLKWRKLRVLSFFLDFFGLFINVL